MSRLLSSGLETGFHNDVHGQKGLQPSVSGTYGADVIIIAKAILLGNFVRGQHWQRKSGELSCPPAASCPSKINRAGARFPLPARLL